MSEASDRKAIKAAARRYFGMVITDAHAAKLLEIDPDLVGEGSASGEMDTLPREDLGDAIIAMLLPGPPDQIDQLIGPGPDRWHWPMNGSDSRYREAFSSAISRAVAAAGIKTATPG